MCRFHLSSKDGHSNESQNAVETKILKKGNEPLNEWLQSMQFKQEMIQEADKGLREIGDKATKAQVRTFELMRGLHTESQTSGQGKSIINVEVMKHNFSTHLSNLSRMVSSSQNRVSELQTLGGCVYVAAKVAGQQNEAKELRKFMKQLVVPLATITGVPATENPSVEEVQAFIS